MNLSFNCLTDLAFLEELSGDATTSLERLDLRDNAISDPAQLFYLRHVPNLKDLRLQSATVQQSRVAGAPPSITSTSANPVCESTSYLPVVLASCPNLQTLDGVPVSVWREVLPFLPSTASTAAVPPRLVAPSTVDAAQEAPAHATAGTAPPAGDVSTPHIDRAASRFLKRYLGDEQAGRARSDSATSVGSPAQAPPSETAGQPEASPGTTLRLDSIEAKLQQLLNERDKRAEDAAVQTSMLGGKGQAGVPVPALVSPARPGQHGHADAVASSSGALDSSTANVSFASDAGGQLGVEEADHGHGHHTDQGPGFTHAADTGCTAQASAPGLAPPPVVDRIARARREGLLPSTAAVQAELGELRAQVAALTAQKEADAAELTVLRTERDELKAKSEETAASHQAEVSQLKSSESHLRGQVEALTAQLEGHRTELAARPGHDVVDSWRARVAELEPALATAPSRDTVTALQARVTDLATEAARLAVAVEEQQRTAARSEARADDAVAQLAAVTAERDSLRASLSTAEAELSSVQLSMGREVELRGREVEAARMAHEQLAGQATMAMVRAREAEAAAAAAKASAEEAARVRSRAEAEAGAARADAERWQTRYTEAVHRAQEDLEGERTRTTTAITAAEGRLTAARAAAEDEIRRVTVDANARLKAARDALASHGARYAALTKALGEAKVEVADLARRLAAADTECNEKDARIASLRDEVARSEADRVAATSGLASREQARVGELLAKLDVTEGQLRQAREDAELAKVAASSARAEVRVKDAILADQAESIKKLKREVAAAREEAQAAEAGYREALTELRMQLEEARASIDGAVLARDDAVAEAERATTAAAGAAKVQEQLESVVQQLRAEASISEELRRALSAREAALSYVEKEVAGLKSAYEAKLQAVTGDRDAAVREAAEEKARADRAGAEAHEARAKADSATQSMAALGRQLAESESSGRAVRARVSAVEEELRVVLRELDSARAVNEQRARRVASLMAAMQAEVGGMPMVDHTVHTGITGSVGRPGLQAPQSGFSLGIGAFPDLSLSSQGPSGHGTGADFGASPDVRRAQRTPVRAA